MGDPEIDPAAHQEGFSNVRVHGPLRARETSDGHLHRSDARMSAQRYHASGGEPAPLEGGGSSHADGFLRRDLTPAEFKLVAPYRPLGDQPRAIRELNEGMERRDRYQTLLGVTGSGKTFTIPNVIQAAARPTLVISHNKTLAAQLYAEFKSLFPEHAVRYFVSYYDYYQPEAYVPQTNTYIEKDASINDEIDKLRHSATKALLERRDTLIVASVSCIYSLGSPEAYFDLMVYLEEGTELERDAMLRKLVDMQYQRNDVDFHRGTFRVRGDVVEIFPAYEEARAIRVELFGDA